MNDSSSVTERTRPRQVVERVSHDWPAAMAILDEGMVCHVGYQVDQQPFVIPMAYARHERQLLLHGAVASRLLTTLASGLAVCVTVTHLDGMVLSRSTFNHSMNYRSVMVFGQARVIDDPRLKDEALKTLVDFLVPGRNTDVRAADSKELNATTLLALPIEEFSVKQRGGPPQDPAKDMSLDTWCGEIPLRMTAKPPVADPAMRYTGPVPDYATDFLNRRRRNNGRTR